MSTTDQNNYEQQEYTNSDFRNVRKVTRQDTNTSIRVTADFMASLTRLFTPKDDGSYPWQEVSVGMDEDKQVARNDDVIHFITRDDLFGLGSTPERILSLLERENQVEGASLAGEKLRACLMQNGGDRRSANFRFDNVKTDRSKAKPATGNSKARTIQEIRKLAESDDQRAEKAQQYLDAIHGKTMSANAAAIQLGIRSKPLNIDISRISPTVRIELDEWCATTDMTKAELIEEALKSYFPIIRDEDEEEDYLIDDESEPESSYEPEWSETEQENAKGKFDAHQVATFTGISHTTLSNKVQTHKRSNPTATYFEIKSDRDGHTYRRPHNHQGKSFRVPNRCWIRL